MKCVSCAGEIPDRSRFCPNCGDELATTPDSATRTSLSGAEGSLSGALPPLDDGRYLPGQLIGGRYRIVGLLGRGGMGEVYRADDLKLGQPVALKFLAQGFEKDQGRLQRLLNEVRTSLKVSHPNVCRVHDVGEVDGHHYLSMEYVDGEDLASLQRRIGRLPQDKAVELARQICAGLHAAHEEGILHRDLKPANVMLDGRGRIKIADFGLAGLQDSMSGSEISVGTPAYMAPEQISGRGVTERSDLYALGLVLYELFTGNRAFGGGNAVEMARQHTETPPTSPSSIVTDLDPSVESVILRCLEKSPAARPQSALGVAAALPGGDPLAAALAAGETPSPELVAEATDRVGFSPAAAGLALALVAVGLALYLFTAGQTQITRLVPLPNSPAVQTKQARDLLTRLGYTDEPGDSTYGMTNNGGHLRALNQRLPATEQARRLADGWPSIMFWYRQSPNLMVPFDGTNIRAYPYDPPRTDPGMVRIWLRPDGKLEYFGIVPPDFDASEGPWDEPDWTPLLAATGVDPESAVETTSIWTPNVNSDLRRAWTARMSAPLDVEVRIEAASFRGRPVLFRVIWPWTRPPSDDGPSSRSVLSRASEIVEVLWLPIVLVVGALLARHNVRSGRGDPRGAVRLGAVMLVSYLGTWLLAAHHLPSAAELDLVLANLGKGLYEAAVVAVMYLALEPYFRKIWPRFLVSWVRVLDGRWRDPLVGRDLLVGVAGGVAFALLYDLYHIVPRWIGIQTPQLFGLNHMNYEIVSLLGLRHALAQMVAQVGVNLSFILTGVMMLLVLRIALRRNLPAYVAWILIGIVMFNPGTGPVALDLSVVAMTMILGVALLARSGLLALVVSQIVAGVLQSAPITLKLSAWYATGTWLALLIVVGLAGYAFSVSLGGRSVLSGDVLEV